jgi:hypothetical protein
MKKTWVYKEMYEERNLKKMFKINMYAGILYAGLSGHVFKGREPWDLKNFKTDSECTEKKEKHKVKPTYILGNKVRKTRQCSNFRFTY